MTRTFLLTDDNHPNYFVGRITRKQSEIKPELWELEIGDYLQSKLFAARGFIREV